MRDVRLRALIDSRADFEAAPGREAAWTPAEWRGWMNRGATYLLDADEGGQGLACCVPHHDVPTDRYLESMWVDPAVRGTGGADELLDATRTWAITHGFAAMWLHVVERNARARRFYERARFRDTGERVVTRPGVVEMGMRCPLASRLRLVEPTRELAGPFLAMAAEWREAGERAYDAALDELDGDLGRRAREKTGIGLRPDRVPQCAYWLLDGDRVVGTSRLRLRLTPDLEKEGGNVGYDVRPSMRRRGYAIAILRRTLERAREQGLREALVTCDRDNVGSARAIEANGGVRLEPAASDRTRKIVDRYRIGLA